jgi:hypothetical protein
VCAVIAVRIAELLPASTAKRARAAAASRKNSANGQPFDIRYVFRWNRFGRKGQTCKVIARGKMNSCMLEFADGWRVVTSRNALRKV